MNAVVEAPGKTRQALIGNAAKPPKAPEPKIKNAATVGWFQQAVHRGRNEIFTEVKTITPAMAEVILSNNPNNRGVREIKLMQITSDMKSGRWAMNGEAIIIAKTGELNDGQHRLQAIIDAKVSLPMLFVFGVDRETRTTLDQGASRSAGDYLHMEGTPNSMQVSAVARMLIGYKRAKGESFGRRGAISASEVMSVARNNREIMTAVRWGYNHYSRMKKLASVSVMAFCYVVLLSQDTRDGLAFMEQLVSGEDLKLGDAIMTARDRLLNLEQRSDVNRVEIILRAWNAYREKRTMRTIPLHGRFPELV